MSTEAVDEVGGGGSASARRASASSDSGAEAVCAHCGLPVPGDRVVPVRSEQFCCHGCEAVYATLHRCGLTQYYRMRASLGAEAPGPLGDDAVPTDEGGHSGGGGGGRYGVFDSPSFAKHYVTRTAAGLCQTDLALENVHCGACLWLIERLPRVCAGVAESRLSLRHGVVRVTWDDGRVSLSGVARALATLGYPPRPYRSGRGGAAGAGGGDGVSGWSGGADGRMVEERRHWVRIALAAACAGHAMLLATAMYAGWLDGMEAQYVRLFRALSAGIGLLALAGPGAVFFRGAVSALRVGVVNLDVPIALALGVGGAAGLVNTVTGRGELYFDSLSVLVLLLLVGRYMQYRQQRWADDSVGLMLRLTPATCRVVRGGARPEAAGLGGEVEEVPIEALGVGDVLEVRPGELIAADGVVWSGSSAVDRSLLTGESRPEAVVEGDAVWAGTRNAASTLRVEVNRVGEDTRVGRLMKLVSGGVSEKPAIVQLTDRIAGAFVVAVTVIAAGVFGWWWLGVSSASGGGLGSAVNHTVALLIVACPCALALTTPLTLALATGKAAGRDILIKRAAVLELLPRGGRVWFDKTGTLTHGRVSVASWVGPAWLKGVVASVEAESTHPIGRALAEAFEDCEAAGADRLSLGASGGRVERGDGGVVARLDGKALAIGSPRFVQSRGVALSPDWLERVGEHESAGLTTVLVAWGESVVALAALGDTVRPEATGVVEAWRGMGWRPGLLSGDAAGVAEAVARRVGITGEGDVMAGVLPEDKLTVVRGGRGGGVGGRGAATVMVGDGVNDAAALAAADLGIAVRGGAEAALSAADVYLAGDGLHGLADLLSLSRRTMAVVRVNLALSLSYNAVAITLAAMGWVNPLVAAVLMPLSSTLGLAVAVGGISGWGRGPRAWAARGPRGRVG